MKKTYPGLSTRRIAVECQPFMKGSNQKIKAKTVQDWKSENVDVEMGLSDMTLSTTTPIEP